MPRPTLREVAEAAEVSPSTVSRYLSGQLKVRPEVRERIDAAVRRLGYVPNAIALQLARRRTQTIGLVVPGISNPFFATLAEAIQTIAQDTWSYNVFLCNTGSIKAREGGYVNLLATGLVDGLIFCSMHAENDALARAAENGLPIVLVDEDVAGVAAPRVFVDNSAGMRQAVQHLLRLGHRRIAFLGGPPELMTTQERRRGYLEALAAAGAEPRPEYTAFGPYTESFGYSAVNTFFRLEEPPTAVAAASDYQALGVLAGARALGVLVPDELSVAGFDDIPAASYVTPSLTTVRQPIEDMARHALELLMARIEGRALPGDGRVILPVELVLRASTVPLFADRVGEERGA